MVLPYKLKVYFSYVSSSKFIGAGLLTIIGHRLNYKKTNLMKNMKTTFKILGY